MTHSALKTYVTYSRKILLNRHPVLHINSSFSKLEEQTETGA